MLTFVKLSKAYTKTLPLSWLGKTFPVGWLGGWMGGLLRKADNKAKAQHNWGLGLAELGNMGKRGNGNITNLRKIGNKNYKGVKKCNVHEIVYLQK